MPKADSTSPAIEAVLWTDGPHAPLLAQLLDVMGGAVRVLAVGGPRVAAVADLAHQFGHEPIDDLRHMLVSHPATFVVIAAADPPDADDLHTALRAGALPVCLEPLAADFDQLHALQRREGKDSAAYPSPSIIAAPAMLQSPGFRLAAHPFDQLGERRVLLLESLGPAGAGSLFARLLDAWRTALAFIDVPQSIAAQITSDPTTAVDGDLPDTLGELRGRLTAHGRNDDGGSISLFVADHAIAHRRRLLALSDQSQLEVTDTGYRFDQNDGTPLDHGGDLNATISYVDLIAHQWRRLIETTSSAEGMSAGNGGAGAADDAGGSSGGTSGAGWGKATENALACCLACLLSARTGQPEDPRAIQRMR